MEDNKYNEAVFNSLIRLAITRINPNISCSTEINVKEERDGTNTIKMSFTIYSIKNDRSYTNLIFEDNLESLSGLSKRLDIFKSDIIHFILTNKEAKALIYDRNF